MKVDTIEEHVIILIGTSEHDHNIETAATTLAVRLNKTSYLKVAYSAPIAHKRRRGQPKKTVGCLARQPNELQFAVGIELPSSDEDEDTPFSQLAMQSSGVVQPIEVEENPVPKKRGRPRKTSQDTVAKIQTRSSKRLRIN